MNDIVLKNKPLIEAILDFRWKLPQKTGDIYWDPNYKLLVGKLYSSIESMYPNAQQLPAVSLPEEMASYVVQHQFRQEDGGWPLVQIGPGVLTLNDTEKYVWSDFEKRIRNLLNAFFSAYPNSESALSTESIMLRYIDAIDFNFKDENVFEFLKSKLKTTINIYPKLFDGDNVRKLPVGLDFRYFFESNKPAGIIQHRFTRGQKDERDALIWETLIQSSKKNAPESKDQILNWVNEAHNLSRDWFFKMIEGDLRKRFE